MSHQTSSRNILNSAMAYSPLVNESEENGVLIAKDFNKKITGIAPDEVFEAVGYKRNVFYLIIYYLLGILSTGFIYLLAYWRPDWKVYWQKRKSVLRFADTLILTDIDGVLHVVVIHEENVEWDDAMPKQYIESSQMPSINSHDNQCSNKRIIRYFHFQYIKYVWNFESNNFECFIGLGKDTTIGSLITDFRGYTTDQQLRRQNLFGKNSISIEVKSYFNLLITEVLNPFYIFQAASVVLWCMDSYYQYAFCVFIISCMSVGVALYETRKQSESLREMVESSNSNCAFIRSVEEGLPVEISAEELVPGDVIVIPSTGCVMACDAVLISGSAIVNESMLTGESVPVTKTAVTASEEDEIYSPETHRRHTLFCGTTIIQTRYYGKAQVLAVVVRTGFTTAKGELVRSITYPRPVDFKFYKDAMKFIGFLFCIALVGMSYSLYIHIIRNKPWLATAVRTLDIVTIVVPPALPAAMTVGTFYAQSRLKKLGIFCISPPRINVAGKLKLICFDKTGTLTEDGLDVWGVVGVDNNAKTHRRTMGAPNDQISQLKAEDPFTIGLASCHSLTYVGGKMIGDPLDLQMFQATNWSLLEAESGTDSYDSLAPTVVRAPSQSQLPVQQSVDEVDSVRARSFVGNCVNESTKTDETGKQDSEYPKFLEEILKDVTTESYSSYQVTPGHPVAVFHKTNVEETSFEVPCEVGIVRQFPFSSSLQRMSVIVRVLGSRYMELYSKGAPEVIQHLCNPETIPEDFSTTLTKFTLKGFRVIALAKKKLDKKLSWHNAQKIKRDLIEGDMTFLGLLVLQNVLKPETTPVIHELKDANIRPVMITGDNILTGICVARDCGIVNKNETVLLAKIVTIENKKFLTFQSTHSGGLDNSTVVDKEYTAVEVDKNYHLAVEGSVWAELTVHFPQYIPYIVSQGSIFARMSPDQKVQVVEQFQKLDYIVGMCGDGANDCGALKAAHVGISLSEAEASVAAPFTSHTPNITCVPQVIGEGRCALTTNFSVFKYMALYSMIQFTSVLILYSACTNLSDAQFLFIDLLIVTSIAIFMGYTKPNRKSLVAKRPLSNLIGPVNLFSVLIQMSLVILIQILAFEFLKIQSWYTPQEDCSDSDSDNRVDTFETNVLFSVSVFQYLALAVIYSPGLPFRKPIYSNVLLISSLVLFTSFSVWLVMYPPTVLSDYMSLKPFPIASPYLFKGTLLLIAFAHFVIGWMIENFVTHTRITKRIFQLMSCKREFKNLYKRIRLKISEDTSWPPVQCQIQSCQE